MSTLEQDYIERAKKITVDPMDNRSLWDALQKWRACPDPYAYDCLYAIVRCMEAGFEALDRERNTCALCGKPVEYMMGAMATIRGPSRYVHIACIGMPHKEVKA